MKKTICSLAALTVITATGLGETSSLTDDQAARLIERVDQLQNEVDRLRDQLGPDWMTEQRAEEIRALVHDVLADADTRASLLQNGMTAGWDGHPFLASADGAFRLDLSGQVQFRFIYNNQSNSPEDDNRWGFGNRRTKLKFSGHVFNDWKYKIDGAYLPIGAGSLILEDAYIERKLADAWSIRFGQFKGPFMREELVSSSRQLAVERSLVNEALNQDRSQGVQLQYSGDQLRAYFMYSDGRASRFGAWSRYDTEIALMSRAELLLMGDWKQFKDFTSPPGSEQALMLGVAALYEKDEYGTVEHTDEEEDLRITADASWEADGWNLFGAFVYQDLSNGATVNPWGAVVQGGFYVTEDIELYARYEYGDADSDTIEDLSVITAGLNKYFNKNVKWTSDIGYGVNEVALRWFKAEGAGWRTDAEGEDGQIVLRTQLQLVF